VHSNEQQQDAAMAVPDAVRRIQVLLAICVQVQGLRCLTVALHTQKIEWQSAAASSSFRYWQRSNKYNTQGLAEWGLGNAVAEFTLLAAERDLLTTFAASSEFTLDAMSDAACDACVVSTESATHT
jgi:hypothetical protein